MPDRSITDNVLIAFEAMHCIDQRRRGKEALMAVKLNMSKAYDRVEWSYLEAMMRRMSFNEKWISLMMICVVHSVLFNIDKRETKREDHPIEGIVTRRSDLAIPFPFMCKGAISYVEKRGKGRAN